MDPKFYEVSPGFGGFLVTFAMAVAVILLMRSLTKHLRKVRGGTPPLQTASAGSQPGIGSPGGVEDGDGRGDVVADEAADR